MMSRYICKLTRYFCRVSNIVQIFLDTIMGESYNLLEQLLNN